MKEAADVTINEEALDQLEEIALTFTMPQSWHHLPYTKIQQLLTLHSLSVYLKAHGITPQFDITIGNK